MANLRDIVPYSLAPGVMGWDMVPSLSPATQQVVNAFPGQPLTPGELSPDGKTLTPATTGTIIVAAQWEEFLPVIGKYWVVFVPGSDGATGAAPIVQFVTSAGAIILQAGVVNGNLVNLSNSTLLLAGVAQGTSALIEIDCDAGIATFKNAGGSFQVPGTFTPASTKLAFALYGNNDGITVPSIFSSNDPADLNGLVPTAGFSPLAKLGDPAIPAAAASGTILISEAQGVINNSAYPEGAAFVVNEDELTVTPLSSGQAKPLVSTYISVTVPGDYPSMSAAYDDLKKNEYTTIGGATIEIDNTGAEPYVITPEDKITIDGNCRWLDIRPKDYTLPILIDLSDAVSWGGYSDSALITMVSFDSAASLFTQQNILGGIHGTWQTKDGIIDPSNSNFMLIGGLESNYKTISNRPYIFLIGWDTTTPNNDNAALHLVNIPKYDMVVDENTYLAVVKITNTGEVSLSKHTPLVGGGIYVDAPSVTVQGRISSTVYNKYTGVQNVYIYMHDYEYDIGPGKLDYSLGLGGSKFFISVPYNKEAGYDFYIHLMQDDFEDGPGDRPLVIDDAFSAFRLYGGNDTVLSSVYVTINAPDAVWHKETGTMIRDEPFQISAIANLYVSERVNVGISASSMPIGKLAVVERGSMFKYIRSANVPSAVITDPTLVELISDSSVIYPNTVGKKGTTFITNVVDNGQLKGITFADPTTVSETDDIRTAIAKLQAQINGLP